MEIITRTGEEKQLKIAFDVDDVLNPFTEKVLEICSEKFGHPFNFDDVEWGFENYAPEETAFIHNLFRDSDFIESVPLRDGVIEMLEELAVNRGHDVVFSTSTYSAVMTTRALGLYEKIPFIHPRNYVMTGRKDLLNTDILFDDCLSHIRASISRVPVLVTKPWNVGVKGYVRTTDDTKKYIEIVDMVEQGMNRQDIYMAQNHKAEKGGPYIIIIVGGSGVGKSTILQWILNSDTTYQKVVTNTTRKPRDGEKNALDYYFRSRNEFEQMVKNGQMVEYTKYAGNFYGTSTNVIDNILASGKNAIAIMDVEGVKHFKEAYPGRTYAILLSRKKEDLINSILERDVPIEEKVRRIAQLDGESREAENVCDYRVLNTSVSDAANEIINIFKG